MWWGIIAILIVLSVPNANAQTVAEETGAGCTNGDLSPSSDPSLLRPALRCLINEERATVGVGRLRGSTTIHPAAQAHAEDMREYDYFAHSRPGWTLMDRLDETEWPGGYAGEALETGCGGLASPSEAFRALMGSPEHRELLLDPGYRRMTIAVIPWMHDAEGCEDPGTWVLDLVGPYL